MDVLQAITAWRPAERIRQGLSWRLRKLAKLSGAKAEPWILRILPPERRLALFTRYVRPTSTWPKRYFKGARLHGVRATLNLCPQDRAHQQIAYCGFIEWPVTQRILSLAKGRGGVLLDVGANYGFFSVLWAAARASNRAYAFECSPKVAQALTENFLRNRLSNAVAISAACWNESGFVLFASDEESGQTTWGGVTLDQRHSSAFLVPAVALDEWLQQHCVDTVDVLKIDTEGADFLVLKGAERALRARSIQHVFFEESVRRMQALNLCPGSAQHLLIECGYQVMQLGEREWYGWVSSGWR